MDRIGVIWGWHDSCYGIRYMREDEYRELVRRRGELVGLQGLAKLPKHRKMIEEQLTDVRGKIKYAHEQRIRNERTTKEH